MFMKNGQGEKTKKDYRIKESHQWGQEIESSLCMRVFPIGIKMLNLPNPLPETIINLNPAPGTRSD